MLVAAAGIDDTERKCRPQQAATPSFISYILHESIDTRRPKPRISCRTRHADGGFSAVACRDA